ncbi:hypothetical protein DPMN_032401, partial [Dreissena polymorpha]
ERKTSLGRDWHPHCLKCAQCGKVLIPGQHAEHKGTPYCHKPCYAVHFGPDLFGYGSSTTSPSRKLLETNGAPSATQDDYQDSGMKCIFKTTNTSPAPLKLNRNFGTTNIQTMVRGFEKNTHISDSDSMSNRSSGYFSGSENTVNSLMLSPVSERPVKDSGLTCIYQSSGNPLGTKAAANNNNNEEKILVKSPSQSPRKIRGAELFKKVQAYNDCHQNRRGQALNMVEEEGNVRIQGPLPIYWGLKKPIILKQFDDVPQAPSTITKRYSVLTDTSSLKTLPEIREADHVVHSPTKISTSHGLDDSVIHSMSSEVVMRKSHIKKSNTVAYRGDTPNKWKRASINGHIYNYDTSVFTPVLGSCTSVTVDNKMTVKQVITTLLEKFKVENQPDDYNLCIVTEKDDERLLKESDIPLLERLILSPTDSVKIFIRDNSPLPARGGHPAHLAGDQSPSTESPLEDIHLPEEVEQLLNIPEPVLKGLLDKFSKDEDLEIKRLKNKYERIRTRVKQIITEKKASLSRR